MFNALVTIIVQHIWICIPVSLLCICSNFESNTRKRYEIRFSFASFVNWLIELVCIYSAPRALNYVSSRVFIIDFSMIHFDKLAVKLLAQFGSLLNQMQTKLHFINLKSKNRSVCFRCYFLPDHRRRVSSQYGDLCFGMILPFYWAFQAFIYSYLMILLTVID